MSTTFGIKIHPGEPEEEIITVARRSGSMYFTNEVAHLLPNSTKVVPMDNTAQGIYSIGDIKKQIKSQSN